MHYLVKHVDVDVVVLCRKMRQVNVFPSFCRQEDAKKPATDAQGNQLHKSRFISSLFTLHLSISTCYLPVVMSLIQIALMCSLMSGPCHTL